MMFLTGKVLVSQDYWSSSYRLENISVACSVHYTYRLRYSPQFLESCHLNARTYSTADWVDKIRLGLN
jgi:hypothetical protein